MQKRLPIAELSVNFSPAPGMGDGARGTLDGNTNSIDEPVAAPTDRFSIGAGDK